jgi:TrmH family RNA methyltransferase
LISDTNARLLTARRLTRRQGRREAGRFLAEGPQTVREALGRSDVVVSMFATADAARRNPELVEAAQTLGVRVDEISVRAAAALSETVRPQGMVAVCRAVHVPLRSALASEPRLVAVLVEANDPGNAGSILRTADAAGAQAVIFAGDSVDVYNGKVVRASAGSIFHVDVVDEVSADDAVTAAREAGCAVLAATGAGTQSLDDLVSGDVLAKPTAWLFGNEANGLPRATVDAADRSVRVPVYGAAESLNVAAAAAVCLYSSARAQRAGRLESLPGPPVPA